MAAPSPLEVDAAAFFHPECNHPQLFHSEYMRSNRTKGLKILRYDLPPGSTRQELSRDEERSLTPTSVRRCFPHCCPEHIDRSYCGTSLSVHVQLAQNASRKDPPPTKTLAVFAHFEAASDVGLRPGQCVNSERIEAVTQTYRNPEGQWIAGVLERPSGLVTPIHTPSDDQRPLVFHLNSKHFSHWCYDWESGANKAQRFTKHVLKAYVVERCAVDVVGNFTSVTSRYAHTQLYRVARVVTSSEFTITSFRRTSSAMPHHDSPESRIANAQTKSSCEAQPSSHGVDSAISCSSVLATMATPNAPTMSARIEHSSTVAGQVHLHNSGAIARPTELTHPEDLLGDTLKWEYANLPAVSVSKNLALLYSFIRWTPLSLCGSFTDELVRLVQLKLLSSFSTASQEVITFKCCADFMDSEPMVNEGAQIVKSTKLRSLVCILSHTTLWFCSKETRQWMLEFFQQHASSVLRKTKMRDCFLLFLHQLEVRMNTQVFAATSLRSLVNVAEEVIAAVYSNEHFYPRRRRVKEILSGQSFVGWNAFVSQMREAYISMTVQPGVPQALIGRPGLTFHQVHPPRNSVESDWNAQWILDVDEAVWEPTQQTKKAVDVDPLGIGDVGPVSLFMLFDIISQIICLDVAIDVQASTLFIRSTQGVAGPLDSAHLILDGKCRVFSQFPNGMPTSTDVGSRGDYIGEMHVKRPDQVTVHFQMFNWAVLEEDGPSYHVRMRIECWRGLQLCVGGDVLTTTAPSSFTAEEVSLLGEMSLREKRAAVNKTHDQWLRLHVTGGGATATMAAMAPWKQLGRLHLSYHKL